METRSYNVYPYDEPTKEQQTKAIERYRDINTDFDQWHDFITDEWKVTLDLLGYSNPEILFSGFSSQGDGACFTATVDVGRYLAKYKLLKRFKKIYGLISIKITHNYRYYYAQSTTVEYELDYNQNLKDENKAHKLACELAEHIEQDRIKLGNQIYKDLYRTYSELTSDEAVADTLRGNDYQFTVDGKID